MRLAREAMSKFLDTRDGVYLDIAKIHVRTARAFSRHIWRPWK